MRKGELITRSEVIEYLRISHGTLTKLMKRHAFPYIKLEKKVLFRKEDIDRFLESKLIK
jgi:excisionase family DNA binding protein